MEWSWHLVSGEYPPDVGGVADYTAILGQALAAAGCEVHVWCPGNAAGPTEDPEGVMVHRVAGRFGPAGLARLHRILDQFPTPRRLLIQYVPQGFGWKGMNVGFAAWVALRRHWSRDDVRVMFHEVAFPWVRRPLRHNLLAAVNRAMAAMLVRSCTTAYVSIPSWAGILDRLGGRQVPVVWTPVPATISTDPPAERVAEVRARLTGGDPAVKVVGHFGTYGAPITSMLAQVLPAILERRPDVRAVLLGSGGERRREELSADGPHEPARVFAPGPLSGPALAEYITACDLMIQPYPDGASGRRTTLMAALANGVPVLTTLGPSSEPVWAEGSVATAPAGRLAEIAIGLLDRPADLHELGQAGRRLYDERFAIGRTIDVLLQDAPHSAVGPVGILP